MTITNRSFDSAGNIVTLLLNISIDAGAVSGMNFILLFGRFFIIVWGSPLASSVNIILSFIPFLALSFENDIKKLFTGPDLFGIFIASNSSPSFIESRQL